MQGKNSNFALILLNRLKSALKIKTDYELANYLGIKQNTISSWKSRDTIDFQLIISKCDNISFDWLISGIGNSFKEKNEAPQSKKECEACKRYERTVNALLDQIELLRDELHECQEQLGNVKKKAG